MNFAEYLEATLVPELHLSFEMQGAWTVEGSWDDVVAKAVRLIRDGQVDILHNTPTHVMANVEGDHGEYESEISRHDPNSSIIEQWSCTCPWNQFAWDRTRQWKYMEGRCCSHVLATYWQGKATPLDTEEMEPGYQAPGGQKQNVPGGQMQLPVPGGQGIVPPEQPPEDYQPPDYEGQIPTVQKKDIAIPLQPPSPFGIVPRQRKGPPQRQPLRLFDVTAPPGAVTPAPVITPTSIPGGAQPTPGQPIIIPGTLSHVGFYRVDERIVYASNGFEEWVEEGLARGADPVVQVVNKDMELELRGGKHPLPNAMPIDIGHLGVPIYKTLELGWNPETETREPASTEPSGAPERRGQKLMIPIGARAYIRAIEKAPINQVLINIPLNTPGLHPHAAEGWVDYADVKPLPNAGVPYRKGKTAASQVMYHSAEGKPFLNYMGRREHMDDYPSAVGTNAYDGDKLVGSVVHGPGYNAGEYFVNHFYVDPEYRGLGVGRKLADDVKANAQGKQIDGDWSEPWLEDYFNRGDHDEAGGWWPWTRETAASQVMYHIAPRSMRESILQYGLTPGEHGERAPDGSVVHPEVHLYDKPESFTEGGYNPSFERDMWEVNVDGLPIESHWMPAHAAAGNYIHRGIIPPERLRLIT